MTKQLANNDRARLAEMEHRLKALENREALKNEALMKLMAEVMVQITK